MSESEERLSGRQPETIVEIGDVGRFEAGVEGFVVLAVGADVLVQLGRLDRGHQGSVGRRDRNPVRLEERVASVQALGRQLIVAGEKREKENRMGRDLKQVGFSPSFP